MMDDFKRQTDALRLDAGITKQDAHTIGAHLLATAYPPAAMQAALEWDEDVHTYGLPGVRALQEMANATAFSRRQWIQAWTTSQTYRNAVRRDEQPDLAAWLNRMRRLVIDHRFSPTIAAHITDVAEIWRAELAAFIVSPAMARLVESLRNAAAALAAFNKAVDPKVCHHTPRCFCRPAPFPAARDYHRRTRHRRRQQR